MSGAQPTEHRITNDALVLHAAATATSIIGVLTLLLEIWTDRWLSAALGLDVFMSTPLGLGILVMAVLSSRARPSRAYLPVVASIVYWTMFFIFL